MAARPEPDIRAFRGAQSRMSEERCPLCDQALPHDLSADELLARLRKKEQDATKAQEKVLRAQFQQEMSTKIEQTKQQAAADAAKREKAIRAEAKTQALAAAKADITKAEQARVKALQDKLAAEEQVKTLKVTQEKELKLQVQKALHGQREALENEKTTAIQKAKAQEFEKNQKLQKQVDVLKRQLEQKTADDLGEGAEVDLYEALRGNFDGDKISRIKKGQPGADVLHRVCHNGQECGSIVYDSKNHTAWRNSFVEKLKADQLAAKADHSVLTTSAFPTGAGQLLVQDDVIIINPARAVELVRIVREHIIQTYRLRLSGQEKNKKTEALYEFINSDRCRQLLTRYESIAEELLEIEVKEVNAHNVVWKKRGQLLRDSQKVHGDYRAAIDRIIEDESLS
jgi:hypothetical protein